MTAKDPETLNGIRDDCARLNPQCNIQLEECDTSNAGSVSQLATNIETVQGRLHGVILSAGYSVPVHADVVKGDAQTFKQVTEMNYLGKYHAAHYLLPYMVDTVPPGNSAKAFLVVGSTASFVVAGPIANTQHCVSKLAQLRLIEHIDQQYRDRGAFYSLRYIVAS